MKYRFKNDQVYLMERERTLPYPDQGNNDAHDTDSDGDGLQVVLNTIEAALQDKQEGGSRDVHVIKEE